MQPTRRQIWMKEDAIIEVRAPLNDDALCLGISYLDPFLPLNSNNLTFTYHSMMEISDHFLKTKGYTFIGNV
jgi:hypothetical protein